ncbi:ankyrin repeat domain-containing protein 35 isoform X15 [Phymastichus coffea]|nr:ankyrin repeat domain-containing protein 35 isoform X15 [Phymastichus coffea]
MDAATGGAVAQAAPELVDAADAEGHAPLHLAVIAGDHQLVAVLLANGADVDAKDLEGHSVLHWATVCGEVECVRLVLAAGADPSAADHRGGSPLHYAAQCCGAAATAELAVPKKVGQKVLQTLLEFGADVNARDEDGRQPILWAASAGSVDAILALARAGGSAAAGASDKDGLTALHCAASRGHVGCIEALVRLCDAQPDHVDDNGCSALHYAATLGHADATALLLELGADANRQDRKGRTPALCAAAKGQLETLKLLVQHGGSLRARTLRGTGVAHEAAASGRPELLGWIARRRPALLDAAAPDGRTPLHVAAQRGHLGVCKLLLDGGARANALMRAGGGAPATPLDAALQRGHRDCAKLVQLHGGLTARRLGARGAAPAEGPAAGPRPRPRAADSSSDSGPEPGGAAPRRRQRGRRRRADACYEERWVERRTRRRASRRGPSRRGSRSFSEEELRLSKTSSRAVGRRRRALSEDARRAGSARTGASGGRPHGAELDGLQLSSDEPAASGRDSGTASDDSLEVVLVRRSLEKTSRKVVSGSKSGAARGHASKDSARARRASRSSLSNAEHDGPWTRAADGKSSRRDADSTSQDTAMEQVTVTADVHKTGTRAAAQEDAHGEAATAASEQLEKEKARSKMGDILERADELQSQLMNKAADLRRDMEDIRQQMSQSSEEKTGRPEEEEGLLAEIAESAGKSELPGWQEARAGSKQVEDDNEETEPPTDRPASVSAEDEGTPIDPRASAQEPAADVLQEETPREEAASEETHASADAGAKDGEAQARRESAAAHEAKTKRGSDAKDEEQPVATERGTKRREQQEESAEVQPAQPPLRIPGSESFRYADESSSSSPRSGKPSRRRPPTGKRRGPTKSPLFESSEERSPDHSAIVAVIESPEWDDEDEEQLDKEIRQVVGDAEEEREDGAGDGGGDEDEDEDEDEEGSDGLGGASDEVGIVRVLPSTSEDDVIAKRASAVGVLPQLQTQAQAKISLRQDAARLRQRRDSAGRDSGIEPSPRVSRIPRRAVKCCPNSERQRALHMDTITRDVQISLRRYHLERKIFFQLMELKRLQIRHGRANESVLVKRQKLFGLSQVESFHKAGMSGPALGVARYDQPYTFRHFESFLYEQLRRLQRRPSTPDWCTEAKQCTQKTHRCHHATSAYTSVPVYTYHSNCSRWRRPRTTDSSSEDRGTGEGTDDGKRSARPTCHLLALLDVEVSHGADKQVIALPSEKLDRAKRYYVIFTVRGDTTDSNKPKTPTTSNAQRVSKSV